MKSIADIFGRQLTSYKDQIQSEEWSKFAKNIRSSRRHCEICKRADVDLAVHHWAYKRNKPVTAYEQWEVAVLCRQCHSAMHECLENFRKYVFPKLTPEAFRVLNGALSVGLKHSKPIEVCYAIAELVSNPRLVTKFAMSWNKPTT